MERGADGENDPDEELTAVAVSLRGVDPGGSRTASVLRQTLDQLYDGVRTGRYRWDQLQKTEKTHCGTLVEINMQREFGFKDGKKLDFNIAGFEVDCKYSQDDGRWMIPPEAHGEICMVLWANDNESAWKMGVVRALPQLLSGGMNRDSKTTLNAAGREAVCWIFRHGRLAENTLLHLPEDTVDQIMGSNSGAERVRRLFLLVQQRPIRREIVATVAQQVDYMKRVRDNGGARGTLKPEGIIIPGHYSTHQAIAAALNVPVPGKGEFVSVRVCPAQPGDAHVAEIDGSLWRVAADDDSVVPAPMLPKR
ncbi:NaeI family type II restriction endonuclease [Candidatus Poriferisodalis sp.]|uniref:NaeI family type II restriction endonuclease n=1 Tax=Candidatus Poriferisodalis sp. TaxID=3101277 RepID=UPI003B5282C4